MSDLLSVGLGPENSNQSVLCTFVHKRYVTVKLRKKV